MAKELYRAAYVFWDTARACNVDDCRLRHVLGDLRLISRDSSNMSKVSMPEMRRYKYNDSLATASIAAGGTLGILIPPSVILVIYGLMTETSVGKLFIAGVLPGLVGVLFYLLAVVVVVTATPQQARPGSAATGANAFWHCAMSGLRWDCSSLSLAASMSAFTPTKPREWALPAPC